tara:strand:- start:15913 stop:17859 length:1947 start_codon:yes stop_codon:yes gene_type:complete
MTTASLGLKVDSSQALTADANLRKMTSAASQAEAAATRLGNASGAASNGMRSVATAANAEAGAVTAATAATRAYNAAMMMQDKAIRSTLQQRSMMIYQLNDVGVSLASGMNPMLVAVQQGSQIFQNGFAPALRTIIDLAKGFVVTFWPVATVVGAVALAIGGMTNEINKTSKVTVGFGDTFKAVGQTLWNTFTNFIKPVTDSIGSVFAQAWTIAADATRTALNYLINSMVGAVKTIGVLWSGLPAAVGEVSIKMANAIISGIEWAINGASRALNSFIGKYNEGLTQMGQKTLPTFGGIDIPRASNPFEGAGASLGQGLGDVANENVDYIGGFYDSVKDQAIKNAIAGNKDLAKAAGEAAKELERQSAAYDKIVTGANQFIEGQRLSVETLGMSAEAIAAAKYEQELLNKAANDNIDLTPQQTEQLGLLAQGMAAAEEAARLMTEAYEFGKGVFTGFFEEIRGGISEGKSLWESLASAATNALDKITSKALDMAMNGVWDMIFGAFSGGFGGGMGSGMAGTSSITGSSGGFFPGFAGGGYTGSGSRSGGMDGQGGFMAMLHPQETVIDHTRGQAANNNGGGTTVVRIELGPDLEGRIVQQAGAQTIQIVQASAPGIAEQGANGALSKLGSGEGDGSMRRFGVQPQAKRR